MIRPIAFTASVVFFFMLPLYGCEQKGPAQGTGKQTTFEDDTFTCLGDSRYEQTIFIQGDKRHRRTDVNAKPRTIIDARHARALQQIYPRKEGYPFVLGSSDEACWIGGTVLGTHHREARWNAMYCSKCGGGNGAGLLLGSKQVARNVIVDGMRLDNTWDAIRPFKAPHFKIRNTWVSHNRDDCIENDWYNGGTVEDSLFDGCYSFYSGVNKRKYGEGQGPEQTVRIQSSLVNLTNMPPAKRNNTITEADRNIGHLWKIWGSANPKFEIHHNVFRIEMPKNPAGAYRANMTWRYLLDHDKLKSCSNNVLIWLGDGYSPDDSWAELPQECFTMILHGNEGERFWEAVKQNWINCHPKVPRLAGDPGTDPVACNPSSYGGGSDDPDAIAVF